MASADPLVFDMSQMSEATPSVFTKRDWLSLQDQQNGNYASNQIVLDTSQLANSNKYMGYRDAYLSVPMILAVTSQNVTSGGAYGVFGSSNPTSGASDQAFGLKNWFGSIVHSMLLDYSGTTIIQQTPLCGLWNCFTMLTTLSLDDINTIGSSIGFYPDGENYQFYSSATTDSRAGPGVNNNVNSVAQGSITTYAGAQEVSNAGWQRRQAEMISADAQTGQAGNTVGSILTQGVMSQLYLSQVIGRSGPSAPTGGEVSGIVYQIQAQIYLKHLHSFFTQIPLLKGVFFRLTLNINNTVMSLAQGTTSTAGWNMASSTITCPLGGVNPIMIGSSVSQNNMVCAIQDSSAGNLDFQTFEGNVEPNNSTAQTTMRVTLNVGNRIIDSTQITQCGAASPALPTSSGLNTSCFLNVPAYTFNPSFEEAYLSKPVKTIMYSDIFQFTTRSVTNSQFNFLITNGISNIKSVLVLPLLENMAGDSAATGTSAQAQFQSPWDSCGGGSTAPLAALQNFNVVVAGQNMVYNQIQYDYQEFEDQLRGINSVNGGLVDGLTSGLIDFKKFKNLYRYYYINCSRMLPIDEAVPKSVSISGTSVSLLPVTFAVFIEYGVQVSVDCLTGARV